MCMYVYFEFVSVAFSLILLVSSPVSGLLPQ